MPSSSKTGHLGLNKWSGTDKPKKDDFNQDNSLIDTACGAMNGKIDAVKLTMDEHTTTISQVKQTATSAQSSVSAHTGNSGIHVTAQEKAAWNLSGSAVMGTYVGDGNTSQIITLGFKPKYGFVFCANRGICEIDWIDENMCVYSGFFTSSGSCDYITSGDTGFTVKQHVNRPSNGCRFMFNSTASTYIYVVWK